MIFLPQKVLYFRSAKLINSAHQQFLPWSSDSESMVIQSMVKMTTINYELLKKVKCIMLEAKTLVDKVQFEM